MKMLICLVALLIFGACASKEQKPVETAAAAPVATEVKKDIAFDGNCGMGLCLKKKVKGDPKYSVDYKGKTYLFSSKEAQEKFVANIDKNIELANKQWAVLGADKK